MTQIENERGSPKARLQASGVEGLDTVLQGGFLAGGIYIIQGEPGTGKTILGNQICFTHVARGGKALYVTLLAESHSRMLLHLQSLQFFDPAAIPEKVYYISAFTEMQTSGLPGLIRLLRKEALKHGAEILVLDGLIAAEKQAGSDMEFKKFIHELQLQCAMLECSMFLLTSAGSRHITAEHTMVDGVLELSYRLHGWSAQRDLRVRKRRGADFIAGLHAFDITNRGVTVFPRIEALPIAASEVFDRERITSGEPQLDGMMGGGIPRSSTTLLIGAAGVGKTTLGLQFLSESGPEERGLFCGFYESPIALRTKADALKLRVSQLLDSADVEIMWNPATEGLIDAVCSDLLRRVKQGRIKRLFIDGMDAMQKLATDDGRVGHILSALTVQLRALGVTTIYTAETENLIGAPGPLSGISIKGASSVAENVLAMRFVGAGTQLLRLIAAVKVRDAPIDNRVRLFEIGPAGLRVDESSARAEQILYPSLTPAIVVPDRRTSSDLPGE